MFKSKIRPIGIPQYEHARLSATLAMHWGNENFDRPEIDFDKFVEGVALHDWQYGHIDSISLSDISEEDWLDLMAIGINLEFADPTVEAIAKLHMKRLVAQPTSERRREIGEWFEERISAVIAEHNLSRSKLEWADSITQFCDALAFDFAYETPLEESVPVLTKINSQEKTPVTYQIKSNGFVELSRWPFSVPAISGFITGYHLDTLPDLTSPLVVPFHIIQS